MGLWTRKYNFLSIEQGGRLHDWSTGMSVRPITSYSGLPPAALELKDTVRNRAGVENGTQ